MKTNIHFRYAVLALGAITELICATICALHGNYVFAAILLLSYSQTALPVEDKA